MTILFKQVPTLAIVGLSNSGKTTLMEKWISALSAQGLNIGSIKHSHHQPEMDTPNKDSWRHKQAGAEGSLLVGPTQMLMVRNIDVQPTPRQLADCYFADYDLVLVEGYASMPCPKIEVVRAACSVGLRCNEEDLLAVVSDLPKLDVDVPVLALNDTVSQLTFILDWMRKGEAHG